MRYIHVVKRKNLWFAITLLMMIPGLISLALFGLQPGLDFKGGTLLEIKVPATVTAAKIKDSLEGTKIAGAMVQLSPNGSDAIAMIRAEAIDNAEQVAVFDQMRKGIGEFETLRAEVVGPTIGSELLWNSIWSMLIVMGGIVGYLSIRFRYDYAICAIGAMAHDVTIVIGIFSILGVTAGYEVDSLFITGLLTVAGFSVHDTIVVFDRIRENAKVAGPRTSKSFAEIADDSINQTMSRSINTNVTSAIVLIPLFIFGGDTIKPFALVMILGILIGTFSSIFVASPVLALWRDLDAARGRARSI